MKEMLTHLTLDASKVKTDIETLNHYGKDWSIYYEANASAVLFPESEEDVSQIVLWANNKSIALVPSGGRTGLSSAATATNREVVVSFERMNKIIDFNPITQVVTVEPGVVTETLQDFAKEKGLLYPVNFAATGSSQIAGNVATNAGGVKVVKYGLTRDWITGLKVVTGKGDTLSLNDSIEKNATGYDLRHLMIGSEGTLGFITEVQVQLTTPPQSTQVLVLGLQDLQHCLPIFQIFNKSQKLSACEFFSELALQKVLALHNLDEPFADRTPYYLLLELEEASDELLEELFTECFEKSLVSDGVIAQSSEQAKNLWSLREFISESISPLVPYKNDVSVKINDIPNFVELAQGMLSQEYPNFEVVWFGHIGDGNVHINILKPDSLSREEFIKTCKKSDPKLYEILKQLNGSISAEHGVGLIKKEHLTYTRAPEEIEIFRCIKKAFDPNGIMNPGKVFDL